MNQSEFLEKVHGLIAQAEAEGGSITVEAMTAPFAEENLSPDQLLSLKSFLQGSGVTILDGREKKAIRMSAARNVNHLENKEKKIYQSYMEELDLIKAYDPAEEEILFSRKAAGDKNARQMLVEGNLRFVVELAGRYAGNGVPLTDLIQEGNMELLLLVDEHMGIGFRSVMEQRVSKAMEMLVEEHAGHNAFKTRMADMANKLMDASEDFADNEGTQPTIEDLARKLHVRPDEVKTVMKMSMDAMTMDETGLGGE